MRGSSVEVFRHSTRLGRTGPLGAATQPEQETERTANAAA